MVWFIWGDCCGLFCAGFTWFVVLFVNYVTTTRVLVPWLGTESWTAFAHIYVYEAVIILILTSHGRAVLSDPGAVPFDALAEREHQRLAEQLRVHSEAREQHAALVAAGEGEDVLLTHRVPPAPPRRRYCKKCTNFKPKHAHHCSICKRCILHMDHHCPWVNNCVGANNLKHFLLFLVWTGVGSGYSIVMTILRGVYQMSQPMDPEHRRHEAEQPAVVLPAGAVPGGGAHHRPRGRGHHHHSAFPTTILLCICSVIMSLFFMVFVIAMLCEQYENVASGGLGGIDALQNVSGDGPRKEGFCANAADAVGEPGGVSWRWFVPTEPRLRRGSAGKIIRTRSEKLV